jgi:MFS family permease
LVETAFSTALAAFQLPAGLLAERWGDYALLVWGNSWVGLALLVMATTGAYLPPPTS